MKVFLSYSSSDRPAANELDTELGIYGANIFRDERDLQFLQNITGFMQSIKTMDYAIMLVSPNFLKSRPCTFEFTEYLKKEKAENSILPVILTGFNYTNELKNEIINHIYLNAPITIDTRAWYKKLFFKIKDKNYILNDWLNRFNATWNFLADTKLFHFDKSKAKRFTDILSYLNIYDKEIIEELHKIIKIQNIEEQDIKFLELTSKHPKSYWVVRYRAYICTRQKQYNKAIFHYKEFLSNFSDKLDMVTGYYDIAICFYKLGLYYEAIRWHETAIKIYPFAYLSHRGLGDAYLKVNLFEDAYRHYLISERYESNFLVLSNLGVIAMKLGNTVKGIEHFKKAIEINGNDPISYLNLSSAYSSQEDDEMNQKVMLQAYSRFPKDFRVLTRYALSNLKESYTLQMVDILRKSYELDPNFIETRINLGLRLIALNPNPEVKKEMKELLFSKKILIETLKMDVTDLEKGLIISQLKILAILLKDKNLENLIGRL